MSDGMLNKYVRVNLRSLHITYISTFNAKECPGLRMISNKMHFTIQPTPLSIHSRWLVRHYRRPV